jgi:hypothetical protein
VATVDGDGQFRGANDVDHRIKVRFLDAWDVPPVYADPELAKYDTNYPWAPTDAIVWLFEFSRVTRQRLHEVRVPAPIMQCRKDSTVAPESEHIIIEEPPIRLGALFRVTGVRVQRAVVRQAHQAARCTWKLDSSGHSSTPG